MRLSRGEEIGFTGTQKGMTAAQRATVGSLLDVFCARGDHVHHGDCTGADEEFHGLAVARELIVEIHPPDNDTKRAFCEGDIVWPPYPYLVRNGHIVNCVTRLIAAPSGFAEELRSGTWATVRRARKKGIPIDIVYPDSGIVTEVVSGGA